MKLTDTHLKDADGVLFLIQFKPPTLTRQDSKSSEFNGRYHYFHINPSKLKPHLFDMTNSSGSLTKRQYNTVPKKLLFPVRKTGSSTWFGSLKNVSASTITKEINKNLKFINDNAAFIEMKVIVVNRKERSAMSAVIKPEKSKK